MSGLKPPAAALSGLITINLSLHRQRKGELQPNIAIYVFPVSYGATGEVTKQLPVTDMPVLSHVLPLLPYISSSAHPISTEVF